jgi:hypothetical protein
MGLRLKIALALLLLAAPAAAQVVTQGPAATTSTAHAWPMKIVFGGVAVDPRDVSDRAGRLLGAVTFSSAQPVTQSGAWSISFTAPQHTICDSGCGSPPAIPDSSPFTFGTTSVSLFAAVVDDVGTNTVAENSYGTPRMSANRILKVDCNSGCSAGTPGQAVMAASSPVVLASDQSTINVNCTVGCSAVTPGQQTMANSAPVVIASNQSAVPVSGTFWQATQPVSGTFWQATQPVSLATAPTTPVTGTFWQATQPVSIATAPALVASSAVIGHVIVDTTSTTAVTQATPANLQATVTQLALTKGTQGATGVTTQDLKDAGRTLVTFTAERVVPILTTDTIVTFSKLVGDTVTATQTTYAVTSGKTLRLQSMQMAVTPSSTTFGTIQVRLRTLSSGACTVAAGVKVGVWELGDQFTGAATLGTQIANFGPQHLEVIFPDGMEFSGATRNVCLSMNALGAAAQVVTITVTGYEY